MSTPPNGVLFYDPRAKPLSTIGLIQPGAYYQFYLTGTLTFTNVYADGGLTTPLSQTPGTGGTTAASDGRLVPIYLDPATTYRIQLYSIFGVLLEDTDPYIPQPLPSQSAIGQSLYPRTASEISAAVTPSNYAYPFGNILRYGVISDWNWTTASGTHGAANATAINAAIKALQYNGGGVLYFPAGAYSISSALNFTSTATNPYNFGNCPIIIQGEGMGIDSTPGNNAYGGTWIVGTTGNWVVDCTGAQYLQFNDLGIRGTGTGAAQLGVLCARSTTANFAQNLGFKNVTIWIDTFPSASSVGSIALANVNAEQFVMEHCWLISDTPLALTWDNTTDLALTSPYTTIYVHGGSPPVNSTTLMNFRNCVFQAWTGYATFIQGASDLDFDTCIWTAEGGNTTVSGIRIVSGQGGNAHVQNIRLSGQVENYAGAIRVDDALTFNIRADLFMPSPTASYVSTGAVVMNGWHLGVNADFPGGPQPCFNCTGSSVFYGGEIDVYVGGSVTANGNLLLTGTFLRGHDVDLSGALGLAGGSTYLALGTNGATFAQPAGQAIVPNASNNATAAAAPNIPTSYLKPDGTVQLSGTFVPNGATTIAAGTAVGTVVAAHSPNRNVNGGSCYIGGTLFYLRVLTNGQVILGGSVVGASSQVVSIDGFSYNLNN